MKCDPLASEGKTSQKPESLAVSLFVAGLAALPLFLFFICVSREFNWHFEDVIGSSVWNAVAVLSGAACLASPFFTTGRGYKKLVLAVVALLFFLIVSGICSAIAFFFFNHIT